MKVKTLHIKEFSDVHVGHNNTPTVSVLDGLTEAFIKDDAFNCDIIFIAGDFFDRLLHLPDPNVFEIKRFINRFLRRCKKYDVVLRVLEGTPSHDWKQSKLFTEINDFAEIGTDVKYVDVLSIEHIERFGIDVLYVPDEWRPETDDTWIEIQQLLADRNLTQVDFSIMHGAFDYQLPSHISAPTHNPQRYLDITRYFIFIGHVHTHSIKDRIIAAGSIDRLTHNEEEAKGWMNVVVRKNGQHDIQFVENPTAQQYRTFKCNGMDVDKALKFLTKQIRQLKDGDFVRIEADRGDIILSSLDTLKKEFPGIRFSPPKITKDKTSPAQTLINLKESYQPRPITQANITELLMTRLKDKDLSTEQLKRAEELLSGYVS